MDRHAEVLQSIWPIRAGPQILPST